MKFVTVMQIILGMGVLGIVGAVVGAYIQAVGLERQERLTERLRGSYGPQALEEEAPAVDPQATVLYIHAPGSRASWSTSCSSTEAYFVRPAELEDEPNEPYDQDLELGQ